MPRPSYLPPAIASVLCRCPRAWFVDAVARLQPVTTADLKLAFPVLTDGEFAMMLVYLQAEQAIAYDGLRWCVVVAPSLEDAPAEGEGA